jgi:NADPH2:quinone reductase
LRPQSDLAKAAITLQLRTHVWPLLASGQISPVMDQEFALADACAAHTRMESSQHIGKIVLKI